MNCFKRSITTTKTYLLPKLDECLHSLELCQNAIVRLRLSIQHLGQSSSLEEEQRPTRVSFVELPTDAQRSRPLVIVENSYSTYDEYKKTRLQYSTL